ncbi:MAG: FecR domain-containing protein, partial [Myxococcaceae bacterium]
MKRSNAIALLVYLFVTVAAVGGLAHGAQAAPATVTVNIITTQSCTTDPNDAFSYMTNVDVKIGPHTVKIGKGSTWGEAAKADSGTASATLKLPPGTYQVDAFGFEAHLGYVTQGVTGKRIDAVDGVATVTLSEETEGLGLRMITCLPHPGRLGKPRPALPPGEVQATGVKGEVRYYQARKPPDSPDYPPGPLKDGMIFWGTIDFYAPAYSEVTLRFKSGSTLLVKPNTRVTVETQTERAHIRVQGGEVVTKLVRLGVSKVGEFGDFFVDTPTATIKAQETSFRVLYDEPKKLTTVWADEGRVLVEPITAKAPPVNLNAGQAVQVGETQVGNVVPAETIISAAGETSRPPPGPPAPTPPPAAPA